VSSTRCTQELDGQRASDFIDGWVADIGFLSYGRKCPPLSLLMLVGQDLINKVKELSDLNKSDLVRECGYVKNDKVCFTQFYEALLEAKGLQMNVPGKRGRSLTYKTKVQFNGKLSIGEGYVQEMGFKPGDEFKIKVTRNSVTLTAA
jgi:hypothetical protein